MNLTDYQHDIFLAKKNSKQMNGFTRNHSLYYFNYLKAILNEHDRELATAYMSFGSEDKLARGIIDKYITDMKEVNYIYMSDILTEDRHTNIATKLLKITRSKQLGKEILATRKRKQHSIYDVGILTGISSSSIKRIEDGDMIIKNESAINKLERYINS